jgi:hypothetical protein
VPRGSPAAVSAAPIGPDALRLDLAAGPSCPPSVPLCGFADGDLLLVFDDSGQHDVFRLTLASPAPALVPLDPAFDTRYGAGSTVCRVVLRTYFRDPGSSQLFTADGDGSAQPIVDRVTALRFDYVDAGGTPLNAVLTDGPWRGTGQASYDTDLLRVRRIRIAYTIQSGVKGNGLLRIPDLTSTFEITLRNAGGE